MNILICDTQSLSPSNSKVARKRGIFKIVKSGNTLTTNDIVLRIIKNRLVIHYIIITSLLHYIILTLFFTDLNLRKETRRKRRKS